MSSSAIRFVLEGEGAYTAVEGEKSQMKHGDFIITANWAPHDHGNPGKQPVMWLDVLDMHIVNHFETSFAEHFDEKMQNTNHEDGNSFERFASGVLPDGMPVTQNRSPVINYPYAKMRPILERLKNTGDVDKRLGARVRYANPINGGPVLPTMGAHLALLPKGFKGEPYRSTDATIFACAEGQGTTIIDGKPFDWGVNDVFVVPSWKTLPARCRPRSRCCSRSPTSRRRKCSASGAKGTDASASRSHIITAAPLAARPFVCVPGGYHAV